ncbi:hypothetical protein BH23VER1_BH23VER1_01180 [soil metagenome]
MFTISDRKPIPTLFEFPFRAIEESQKRAPYNHVGDRLLFVLRLPNDHGPCCHTDKPDRGGYSHLFWDMQYVQHLVDPATKQVAVIRI